MNWQRRVLQTVTGFAPSERAILLLGSDPDDVSWCAWECHRASRPQEPMVVADATELQGADRDRIFARLLDDAGKGTFFVRDLYLLRREHQAALVRLLERGWFKGAAGVWWQRDVQVIGSLPDRSLCLPHRSQLREDLLRLFLRRVVEVNREG